MAGAGAGAGARAFGGCVVGAEVLTELLWLPPSRGGSGGGDDVGLDDVGEYGAGGRWRDCTGGNLAVPSPVERLPKAFLFTTSSWFGDCSSCRQMRERLGSTVLAKALLRSINSRFHGGMFSPPVISLINMLSVPHLEVDVRRFMGRRQKKIPEGITADLVLVL
jgi:hypothetical protein